MSEYATLKRRPILFPDSVSSFHDSIFSLKEELKALVADDLQNKDAYVQTARRSNPSPTAPCARWATCTARAS